MPLKIGGYLFIDNRASPGVPEQMVQQFGKEVMGAPEGQVFEADTYTCAHCQSIVLKNPLRVRARNQCGKCKQVVCESPGCNILGECVPYRQKLDEAQEKAFLDEQRDGNIILLTR